MKYPRKVGSDKVVHEHTWNQDAPFGHCPACGLLGIEELHSRGREKMYFYCSDSKCQTILNGMGLPMRTKWNVVKPEEMQQKEIESTWSWNQEHWPSLTPPADCPA